MPTRKQPVYVPPVNASVVTSAAARLWHRIAAWKTRQARKQDWEAVFVEWLNGEDDEYTIAAAIETIKGEPLARDDFAFPIASLAELKTLLRAAVGTNYQEYWEEHNRRDGKWRGMA